MKLEEGRMNSLVGDLLMDLAEVGHMDVASHRNLGNVSCISKNLGKLYY